MIIGLMIRLFTELVIKNFQGLMTLTYICGKYLSLGQKVNGLTMNI